MKKLTPLRAIRAKCLECSGDSAREVRLCEITECPLYLYRLGKRPREFKAPSTIGVLSEASPIK